MKKLLGLLLALALLLGCCSAFAEAAAPALTKDLVILFTSDVHCGIDQNIGYVGLASIRDKLAKQNHVILVDNGDSIQGEPIGTMTTGGANVELMNAIGYEVAIPGNHEFDYGMDRFLELTQLANFPYISANFNKSGELVFKPYVIKEYDGVKVAFVGATTPRTLTSSTPKYFQDEAGNFVYGFFQGETGDAFYAAVQSAVDAARMEGADYVVVMAHLGIEAECSPYMSTELIANTTGVDALLDGHSHSELPQEKVKNKEGKEVLQSACGTKLKNVGYLRIAAKDGKLSTGLYTWTNDVALPDLLDIDNAMVAAVDNATTGLKEKLAEVVAESAVDLVVADPETGARIVRSAETNLGDLCADAYRAMSGADIAFVNGGGVRVPIKAGAITLNDILRVHPFGNAMCVVETTGQQILDALEMGVRALPAESGGFLQVSGLTYEIHTYVPSSVVLDENGMFAGVAGEYRVKNVKVGGEALDLNKTYTLASHNYMLKGSGDGINMFQNDKLLQDEVMLDNQVLINYITGTLGGVVGDAYANPYGEGRIVAVSEAPAN